MRHLQGIPRRSAGAAGDRARESPIPVMCGPISINGLMGAWRACANTASGEWACCPWKCSSRFWTTTLGGWHNGGLPQDGNLGEVDLRLLLGGMNSNAKGISETAHSWPCSHDALRAEAQGNGVCSRAFWSACPPEGWDSSDLTLPSCLVAWLPSDEKVSGSRRSLAGSGVNQI